MKAGLCLLLLVLTGCLSARAQSGDFNTWTKLKVSHKLDARFAVSGDLELRTKANAARIDRWGLVLGGSYRPCPFLNVGIGYETHLREVSGRGWTFRHRYHLTATASFRRQWLEVSLRERFQQTFDHGESETRLRSRLKVSFVPDRGIVAPYASVEVYQSLDDAPFWQAARVRYRPGIAFELSDCWSLDAFYCYQYTASQGKHIAGVEVGFEF